MKKYVFIFLVMKSSYMGFGCVGLLVPVSVSLSMRDYLVLSCGLSLGVDFSRISFRDYDRVKVRLDELGDSCD